MSRSQYILTEQTQKLNIEVFVCPRFKWCAGSLSSVLCNRERYWHFTYGFFRFCVPHLFFHHFPNRNPQRFASGFKPSNACMSLIRPYLKTLKELVELCPRKTLFINGAGFKPILKEIGFQGDLAPISVNENLLAHTGECFNTRAVWFDKFLSGQSAAATNKQLYDAGRNIQFVFNLSL